MDTLKRVAGICLRNAAKRPDYFNALWVCKNGNQKHKYRIVKRVGVHVYLQGAELGAYPPRGLSSKMTVDEFRKTYDLKESFE